MKLALSLVGCACSAFAVFGGFWAIESGGLGFAWLSGALAIMALWCALHGWDMAQSELAAQAAELGELDRIAPRVRERVAS